MKGRESITLAMVLLAGCATAPAPPPTAAPADLGSCAFGELREFHAHAYVQLVAQVTELGRLLLERELAQPSDRKPAIVLDIDETSLSNWDHLERALCAPVSEFNEFAVLGVSSALQPTLELYRWARERGVATFFVTGRREWMREATERNLREVGFDEYEGIFLRPNEEQGSWHNYKAYARQQVTEAGYDVLLNLGDQPADLTGGYTRYSLLIPNPFYVVTPRDFSEPEDE